MRAGREATWWLCEHCQCAADCAERFAAVVGVIAAGWGRRREARLQRAQRRQDCGSERYERAGGVVYLLLDAQVLCQRGGILALCLADRRS